MLYVITEKKTPNPIIERLAPFVEDLRIVYAESWPELAGYKVVKPSDTVLFGNQDNIGVKISRSFPNGTRILNLNVDSAGTAEGDNVDISQLFIQLTGHPRIGAFLSAPEILLYEQDKGTYQARPAVQTLPQTVVEVQSVSETDSDKGSDSGTAAEEKPKTKSVPEKKASVKEEKPKPVVEKRKPEVTTELVFEEREIRPHRKNLLDPSLEGVVETELKPGVPGVKKFAYLVTKEDGVEVSRKRDSKSDVTVTPAQESLFQVSQDWMDRFNKGKGDKRRQTPKNQGLEDKPQIQREERQKRESRNSGEVRSQEKRPVVKAVKAKRDLGERAPEKVSGDSKPSERPFSIKQKKNGTPEKQPFDLEEVIATPETPKATEEPPFAVLEPISESPQAQSQPFSFEDEEDDFDSMMKKVGG